MAFNCLAPLCPDFAGWIPDRLIFLPALGVELGRCLELPRKVSPRLADHASFKHEHSGSLDSPRAGADRGPRRGVPARSPILHLNHRAGPRDTSPRSDPCPFLHRRKCPGLRKSVFAGILILSLFEAAYFSEIFRGAWQSIPQSTLNSARAIGLTPQDTFSQIITPLALRNCLPSLASQTASLIKDSSLLSIIAVSEVTHVAQEINAFTYSTLESYLPLALAYLLLTAPLALLSRRWERSLAYAN